MYYSLFYSSTNEVEQECLIPLSVFILRFSFFKFLSVFLTISLFVRQLKRGLPESDLISFFLFFSR